MSFAVYSSITGTYAYDRQFTNQRFAISQPVIKPTGPSPVLNYNPRAFGYGFYAGEMGLPFYYSQGANYPNAGFSIVMGNQL